MDPNVKAIVVLAAVIVVGLAVAWMIFQRRRTETLQRRFGPEYQRAVREHGLTRGESILAQREKRVEKFSIRELASDEHENFVTEWREVQSRFVDDPRGAVAAADRLVVQLMQARGYPMSDFEQRAADVSVTLPRVVDNYRAAREIALRDRKNEATTEDMRRATTFYRSLFGELLGTGTAERKREVA